MQLFILDRDPLAVPRMLCDAHVRKMCLETAQILSSVLCRQGKMLSAGMPRPYNLNHPVVRALDTPWKVNWAVRFNRALHREYIRRFDKPHAYHPLCPVYRKRLFRRPARMEPDWSFARDFRNTVISDPDIVLAYREYYRLKKKMIRNWKYTRTSEPEWL